MYSSSRPKTEYTVFPIGFRPSRKFHHEIRYSLRRALEHFVFWVSSRLEDTARHDLLEETQTSLPDREAIRTIRGHLVSCLIDAKVCQVACGLVLPCRFASDSPWRPSLLFV